MFSVYELQEIMKSGLKSKLVLDERLIVMDKTIILLTKNFPYDKGEEFLENEIDILSSKFNCIYIIATAVNDVQKLTRPIPNNVKVFGIQETTNRYVKYFYNFIKGLSIVWDKRVREEIKTADTFLRKVSILYISGKCYKLFKEVLLILNQLNLSQSSSITIYCYWFLDLPIVALLLKEKLKQHHINIVSRAHGYDLYSYRIPGNYMPYRRLVMSKIDMVLPCSKNGEDYLKKEYPMYKDKIKFSYLGTMDHGLSPNRNNCLYHIVTCSSIIPLKRIDLLVDAIALLEESGHVIKWTCIGEGNQLKEIRKKVSEFIRQSEVIFTGRLDNKDVLSFYKNNSIDLFVNVSETEGLPVSIMEAISFGIPVLATNVGGTSEIVVNGVTGLLVDKEITKSDLANALLNMKEYNFNRESVRNYWEKHFNAMVNYSNFSELMISL